MCIKILTYYNLYLYSYFFYFSLPSKFLTKPLRVLEDEVNKTNKQTMTCFLHPAFCNPYFGPVNKNDDEEQCFLK